MEARPQLIARLGLPLALFVVAAMMVLFHALLAWHPAERRVEAAYQVSGWDGEEIPPQSAAVSTVALPHRMDHGVAAAHSPDRYAWYRITVQNGPEQAPIDAVLVWSQSANATAYLNGHPLPGLLSTNDRIRQDWLPVLFGTLPQWLDPGPNNLLVRVRMTTAGRSMLGQVYFGDEAALSADYDLRGWLILNARYLLLMLLVFLSIPAFSLWLRSRQEREFLWLVLALLTLALYAAQSLVPDTVVPSVYLDWGSSTGFAVFMWFLRGFVYRLLGWPHAPRERLMAGLLLSGLVVTAALAHLSPRFYYAFGAPLWDTLTFAVAAHTTLQMVNAYRRTLDSEQFSGMLAGLIMLATRAHDVLVNNAWLPSAPGYDFFFAMPVVLFIYVHIILLRLQKARSEAESLSREMSDRVLAKQHEIERTFEELRAVEAARTLSEERGRIMRDMHDGVGGALVSALAGLEQEGAGASGTASNLRAALSDLRLMITSMRPGEVSLRPALAELRQRIEAQSADVGLQLQWSMQELDPNLAFDRVETLQMMRVVQEAFTNVIKHARARCFSFDAAPQEANGKAGLLLRMRDDGSGFDTSLPPSGNGLGNMEERRAQLGGSLTITSSSAGTIVSLWVPLASPG
ncbi:MAG: sensor histidine kinase [Nevskiales bacterium]